MKTKNRLLTLLAVAALIVAMGTGCSVIRPSGEAAGDTDITLTLYFAGVDAETMVAEVRTLPKAKTSPAEQALAELIAGPQESGNLRTLPEESVIISVSVQDGVALVDLGQATVDHHWGGSLGDRMSIDSIVYTLTELEGISSVQLLLEGETVEAVFGHVATDVPITRREP